MARTTILWGLILGMVCCQVLLGALSSSAAGPDPSAYVAEWKGGGVTAREFTTWWQFSAPADRAPLKTLEERQAFLETLVSAKLMADEAESLGITLRPDVIEFYVGRRNGLLTEAVQMKATQGRIRVDPREVEDIYRKRLTEMEISQITVKTEKEGYDLLDSIKAGVPFEDLAKRHSTSPNGEQGGSVGTVRWGDFSERWSAQAFRLEPGQVSQPFQIQGGYCILKSYSKTLVEPEDSNAEKARVRGQIERDATIKERTAYLDSLKTAYGYNLDIRAIIDLCARYAAGIGNLDRRNVVLDADVTPTLTDAERQVPLIVMKGKNLTTGAMVDLLQALPYQVRPALDNPDEVAQFINIKGTDSLLVAEGMKLGLDKDPDLLIQVEKAKQRKILSAFHEYITQNATVPEQEITAYYQSNAKSYNISEGYTISKIVVGTKEAADSVLMRLNGGEAFGDIARARSRDPFTAPQGGSVGYLRVGDDEEFDGFLGTMQVGEKKAFRSLEGYVVLWMQEKHSPRSATLEEAQPTIIRTLIPKYRDEALQKWLAGKRAEVGVKVNTAALEAIVLPT